MKKVLILLALTPIISFSQTYYNSALDFQNSIRSFYNLNPYTIDFNLNEQAQKWAEQMAITDEFDLSTDNLGETIYYFRKTTNSYRPNNMFLDAVVSWAIDADDASFNQTICSDCSSVGFGVAENLEYIYVVAKYDKLYK